MQPQIVLSVPEQVLMVVSFVAAARVRVPQINGWWVIVASLVASLAISLTQVPWTSLEAVRPALQSGVMVFLYAVGGVSAVQTASKPILDAISGRRAASSPAPAAEAQMGPAAAAPGAEADGK